MASDITGEERIACVKREIAMRCAIYPRWVASGRLTQEKADREIAAMESVLSILEDLELSQKYLTACGVTAEEVAAACLKLWKNQMGES